MLIHPWDEPLDEREWRMLLEAQRFGQLVAGGGPDRPVPVVVPTQYVLDGEAILLHLTRPNPVWAAIAENPTVVLSVVGDWAYIPGAWKAIGDEDPTRGIPTTYYAAVQITAEAEVVDDDADKAELLRRMLAHLEPGSALVDPAEHGRRLSAIRGLRLALTDVRAKFKYGGNLDDAHRKAITVHLALRDGPGDHAAAGHARARIGRPTP